MHEFPPPLQQAPPWHDFPLPHTLPHAPQFELSVSILAHEPLHIVKPLVHWQLPEVHAWLLPHAAGHVPQCEELVSRLTQPTPEQ